MAWGRPRGGSRRSQNSLAKPGRRRGRFDREWKGIERPLHLLGEFSAAGATFEVGAHDLSLIRLGDAHEVCG
jgi:hypothetical protein